MTVAIAIGMTGPIGREMTVAGDWDDGSGTIAVAMNFFIPRGECNTRGSGTFAVISDATTENVIVIKFSRN